MESKKKNRIIAYVVVAAGLLMGPVNLVYCWYLSGSTVGSYELKEKEAVTVPLSPEMTPVSFLVTADFKLKTTRKEEYEYRAVLERDSGTIWEKVFKVSPPQTDADDGGGFQTGVG